MTSIYTELRAWVGMEGKHLPPLCCLRLDIADRTRDKCLRYLGKSLRCFSPNEEDPGFLLSKLSLTDVIQSFSLSPSQANSALRCSPCNQRLCRLSVVLAPAQQLPYAHLRYRPNCAGTLLLCAQRKWLGPTLVSAL